MAFEQLLEWTSNRPEWQQDALRRFAQSGELTEDDLSGLRLQIENSAGLPVDNVPAPIPLAAEHLSEAASNQPKTVLASLGPVQRVDRLAGDQPPLRFAVNGVTLIYGANASGKSGYCRITKQLCRSLSPGELRGNVYDENQGEPPEIAVAFRVGDDDQPKQDRIWAGDAKAPAELARISVFDTASARVYVDKERKIEFLPYELDLLNKLGLGCRALDQGFREREAAVNAAVNTPLPTGYTEGTTVYAAIAKLVTATALDQLPSEQELRTLGTWTGEKQAELDRVAETLSNDPAALMRLRTTAKQALETIKEEVSKAANNIGDLAILDIRNKQQDAQKKATAAEAAARDMFRDQPIPELGSEVWRQMLLYARDFATSVFTDKEPPQLATGGICVLCQQDLDEEAVQRMTAFDGYIAGRAAEESATATRIFEDLRGTVLALALRGKREVDTLLAGYAALSDATKQNVTVISAFIEKAGERLETIKRILRDNTYDGLDALEPLSASPTQLIDDEIVRLEQEIAELKDVERDENAIVALRVRRAELSDQKRLSEEIEIIAERRNKLEERHRLVTCRSECRLTAITRRITDRRREILTPALKTALNDELKTLRLTHIPLNLADRGDAAESVVEVALTAQQRIANNSDVLSEGEQRALALACFLAELGELGRDHGIIVDDPVSSLDHKRMQAVAERLAEEAAKGRQVIVFTHNILFHHMLRTETRRARIACHTEWMSSLGNDQFGIIDDSRKPRQMKSVPERLQEIDRDLQALIDAGYDHADENFRSPVVALYTQMRDTWERVVEDILFNRVVQRFRPEIMTQRLEEASIDPENDYPAIFEGMKRCSHYSGHDPAEDLPPELPEPEHVRRDFDELKRYFDAANVRRRKLRKARPYEEGLEPVLL